MNAPNTQAIALTAEHRSPAGVERPNATALAALSLGHLITDSYGHSLLLPLLPVFKARLNLGLDEIGAVPMIMGLAASLSQPWVALVTDRWPRIPAVVLGPAVAAAFAGLAGLAPSHLALVGVLFLAGVGIAAFHPQGASLACRLGRGRGLAMSAFTVGGNIGFGIAPALGALYFAWFGLERFYLASVPGLGLGCLLGWLFRPGRNGDMFDPVRAEAARAQPGNPLALTLLTGTVIVRTAVQITLSTFLSFLLLERIPESGTAAAGMALSAFWLANAVASPLGGFLSDRCGRRPVMIASFAAAPLLLFAGLQLPGYWLVGGLALGALVLGLPHPANVVMAQEYMPAHAGLAASMITGLAWGLGQFVAWPAGALAEVLGLDLVLSVVCALPLLGIVLVLPLPDMRRTQA